MADHGGALTPQLKKHDDLLVEPLSAVSKSSAKSFNMDDLRRKGAKFFSKQYQPQRETSGGGGAPLFSPKASSGNNLSKDDAKESTQGTRLDSSDSDDAAQQLIQASRGFANIGRDVVSPQQRGAMTSYGPLRRASTTIHLGCRPFLAKVHQTPPYSHFNNYIQQRPPPAGHPYFEDCAHFQEQLVTVQQYVCTSPGVPAKVQNDVKELLIKLGQGFNAFIKGIVDEQQRGQYSEGELQLLLTERNKELDARLQQVIDLQEDFGRLKKEDDLKGRHIADLEKRLRIAQEDAVRFQAHHERTTQDFQDQDLRHHKQVLSLEAEIKALRAGNSMQLVKAGESPDLIEESALKLTSSGEDETSLDKHGRGSPVGKDHAKPRRRSALNPEAPIFGPRIGKGLQKEVLGMLQKYEAPEPPRMTSEQRRALYHNAFEDSGISTDYDSHPFSPQDARVSLGRPNIAGSQRHTSYQYSSRNRVQSSFSQSGTQNKRAAPYGGQPIYKPLSTPEPSEHNLGFRPVDQPLRFSDDIFITPALPRDKENWDHRDMASAIKYAYEVAEGIIASQYEEPPFLEPAETIPQNHPAAWHYIVSLGIQGDPNASSSHMGHLLTIPEVRPFVIKRILTDFMFNRILQPDIFSSFEPSMHAHLKALQQQLAQLEGPGRASGKARQKILEDHSKLIKACIKLPDGANHKNMMCESFTETLEEIMRPLRRVGVDKESACKAIISFVRCCWIISSKLWTSHMTLHYVFPATGSKFSFATQRPMNEKEKPVEELQYTQRRIMLIISPTLTLREEGDVLRMALHELMKSDVLVMK